MKSEYKTFREAYEAYVDPETRAYTALCLHLDESSKLKQKFKKYYDPKKYSKLVVETDQLYSTFMSTKEEISFSEYTREEIDRRATALAFLAAMEEEGDL